MATEHIGETRDRIFCAAAHLFAVHGYAKVSMREIAAAAGVSKPMLYYYFESKLGLCRALLADGATQMTDATRRIATQPAPVVERLRSLIKGRFSVVREHPDVAKFYMDFFNGPDETGLVAEYGPHIRTAMRALHDLIAEAQRTSEFRGDVDPMMAATMLVGATNIHVYMFIRQGTPLPDDAMADEIVSAFIEGMRPYPPVSAVTHAPAGQATTRS